MELQRSEVWPLRDQWLVYAGHNASVARAAAWLSRVPLRLPLCFLRRHSTQLHPSAEPRSQCIPAQHATARSVHAQPEGRHAAGDHPCTSCHVELCQLYSAAVIQEGWFHTVVLFAVVVYIVPLWCTGYVTGLSGRTVERSCIHVQAILLLCKDSGPVCWGRCVSEIRAIYTIECW